MLCGLDRNTHLVVDSKLSDKSLALFSFFIIDWDTIQLLEPWNTPSNLNAIVRVLVGFMDRVAHEE